MRWGRATIGLFLGLGYAALYFCLAFAAAGGGGAGHGPGTLIFFAVALPYGAGLLFFPVIGFLVAKSFTAKLLFVSVTVIHYTLVINFLRIGWLHDPGHFQQMWNYSPIWILLPGVVYLSGQILIWVLFVRAGWSARRSR